MVTNVLLNYNFSFTFVGSLITYIGTTCNKWASPVLVRIPPVSITAVSELEHFRLVRMIPEDNNTFFSTGSTVPLSPGL
jgi:hypothetical protein